MPQHATQSAGSSVEPTQTIVMSFSMARAFLTGRPDVYKRQAADKTIIAPEKIVEVGEIDPDMFAVAGVLVDAIAEGEKPWQI